jgi:serine phosphatase RsbU (regulator of sigma subunit)
MNKCLLLFLLLLFLVPNLFAQKDGQVFLSYEKIVNPKGNENGNLSVQDNWKFHWGDNLKWKLPAYNDSAWQIRNTSISQDSIPDAQNIGKCWFRLKIKTDSSLFGKNLALLIRQRGASEIYLDGKLVHEFGKVGSASAEEKVFNPANTPIGIYFDSSKMHLLAIRYSYMHIHNIYRRFGRIANNAGINISIGMLDSSVYNHDETTRLDAAVNLSLFGIVISLALLHLLLYFFYRDRIDNLYYSIFSFSIASNFFLGFLIINSHNPVTMIIFSILTIISLVFIFLFFLAFIYKIYYKRIPKLFRVFVIYGILVFITPVSNNFLGGNISRILIYGFAILTLLEGFRVLALALVKKVQGIWIIGIGGITFILVLLFSFVLSILKLHNIISDDLMTIIVYLGIVSLPVFMSIYLARDFANTNKNLSEKLNEVEELSQKSIEHEKKEAELKIESEKEKAQLREAELLAKALEAENERKAKELEEARNIQLSMLPKKLPVLNHLDIAVYMQTATEVGGDYYDFSLNDEGILTTVLGDATGHGVKAGVIVTAIKSMFISNSNNKKIPMMFQHFSKSLRELNMEYMYMCLAVLKINGYNLKIASAGIPPALLYRKNNDSLEYITLKGLPLGSNTEYPYEEREIKLFPGDTIIMMSDGYPELFNDHEEMFGYENILSFVKKIVNDKPEEIIASLKKSINEWRNNIPVRDDITFIVMKVK